MLVINETGSAQAAPPSTMLPKLARPVPLGLAKRVIWPRTRFDTSEMSSSPARCAGVNSTLRAPGVSLA